MRKGDRGFTLIEVTIIILVLVVLGAILTPLMERYIDLAKIARVREDLGTIASAIETFKVENCHNWFKRDASGGSSASNASNNRVDLLVSGLEPVSSLTVNIPAYSGTTGTFDWTNPVGVNGSGFAVDTMYNQLVLNTPMGSSAKAYPRYPTLNTRCGWGWLGKYLQPPEDDPWGYRYAANVEFLAPPYDGNTQTLADKHGITQAASITMPGDWRDAEVIVLSAGVNGTIETLFWNLAYIPTSDDQFVHVK